MHSLEDLEVLLLRVMEWVYREEVTAMKLVFGAILCAWAALLFMLLEMPLAFLGSILAVFLFLTCAFFGAFWRPKGSSGNPFA